MTNQSFALQPHKSMDLIHPSALGTIEQYIQEVNRIPMLTAEQEKEFAERLQDKGDIKAAQALVLSHLRLVVSVARQYLGYGLSHADLIQEGNIGLMKAVKRFDISRGVRLVTFALHWIKAEIHEFVIRNWRLVKIATTKAQRKLFFNLNSLRPEGRSLDNDDIEGIAKKLNVRPEDVVEMEKRMSGHDIALDTLMEDDDDYSPIQYLADDEAYEPENVILAQEQDKLEDQGLKAALEKLDDRSRHIIESRWLSEDKPTLHDLAAQYNVSAERIRQIENAAIKKMRAHLEDYV
ncbi:RNA polymerase sigma factor [Taylorella asinigenitalis 14/45]|uniref:RNA polymerase sigma factor RpoH n=1 Tax=Taylorella asinigenitalis 14/45 TaxID=1091495 RepID=I7ILG1_9BURK|nr:RNA polymerase sigma factor RpoH [Taylorella asinigenitalis]CCG20054.1 RNA polymerase sigma factor [Taylorella asinigenitalis 14/45]